MPTLDQHQSNNFTKMMVLGDPGSGKTGGLTPLVKAGYHLGILDYDNGLDPLVQFIKHECPDKLHNVHYVTLRDKYRATAAGPTIIGAARAFVDGMKLLDKWHELGAPGDWGPEWILVIDSLTMMSKAAFDWREQLIVGEGKKYDQRAVYYDSQKIIEKTLANIASESFHTNVVVLTHIHYSEDETGVKRGYPKSVGSALSTWIGAYFNSLALCETTTGGKRIIRTTSTPQIELKNPRPFEMMKEYPISSGLADFFEVLKAKEKPNESRDRSSPPVVQSKLGQPSRPNQRTISPTNRPMRRA